MSDAETQQRPCWCGQRKLLPFSAEYRSCELCGTLVSQLGLTAEEILVRDDVHDFYGKRYWLEHQTTELHLPPIEERAANDLAGRCVSWLRKLLNYRLPPARVLELGSAHGALVALLSAAGYDATGLELSPWVVNFARQTFQVTMLQGPVEEQPLEDESFDVIILNDLLEHLPSPVDTISHCRRLLRPDGVLVIQTPCYPFGLSYDRLCEEQAPFLEMMSQPMGKEHLYLFSEASVRRLLNQVGLHCLSFEPACYVYDMYLFASPVELRRNTEQEARAALCSTPTGRLIDAWLQGVRDNARMADEITIWAKHCEQVRQEVQQERDKLNLLAEACTDLGPASLRLIGRLARMARRFPRLASATRRLFGLAERLVPRRLGRGRETRAAG
jgi:2-polyprenyl-3-methyl-5-hydroxy-6-metoxy-1,4-benzoquinol methylase